MGLGFKERGVFVLVIWKLFFELVGVLIFIKCMNGDVG